MAMSIPVSARNFRLMAGVHGRFSGGMRQPMERCFARAGVKKWWCTSIRGMVMVRSSATVGYYATVDPETEIDARDSASGFFKYGATMSPVRILAYIG